uniref:Minor capsid protein P11 C-terminal conserved region domain-containing protein n=1 Tax=viral metagenome TaxID=1070528 RepID=A0A6C0CQT9_9ZZZZ
MKSNKFMVPLAILLVAILLGFLFVSYNQSAKKVNAEKFGAYDISDGIPNFNKVNSVAQNSKPTPDSASGAFPGLGGSDPQGNEVFNPVTGATGASVATPGASCFPRDRLTAEDLLPKDAANSKWAQMNPMGQGDVRDQNFLTAGYHIGINTQGQSLRNANYQLRSEPANPQMPVSPWNIATIEPDINRKPLEIGGDY